MGDRHAAANAGGGCPFPVKYALQVIGCHIPFFYQFFHHHGNELVFVPNPGPDQKQVHLEQLMTQAVKMKFLFFPEIENLIDLLAHRLDPLFP